MARSRKEAAEALARRIAFRVTEDDYRSYLEKVAASGMHASEFFRQCLLTNRTQIVARKPASADRKRALYVMNKASNNLNQLAHAVNTERMLERVSEETFLCALDSLQSIELLLKAYLSCVD
jgi:hypothetical protein